MPVAVYQLGVQKAVRKNFATPKRMSDLRYWYVAAAKALRGEVDLPLWAESFRSSAGVEVDYIVFAGVTDVGTHWHLAIHRKGGYAL